MGIRLGTTVSSGVLAGAMLLASASAVSASAAPGASTGKGADVQIARTGSFVLGDFPAGFSEKSPSPSSSADNIKLAKGLPGCAPYIALQKATGVAPQATSSDFEDDSRTISNEVDVFKAEKAATDAMTLYAKPSVVGCLQQLFKKQIGQDPETKGKVESVSVTLERQDIAGLGDDSVVYEGSMVLTGTDGSTTKIGVGNAAVRVGRAVDDVTYLTTDADLTDVLAPAIDASVTRLRTALGAGTLS